MRANFSNKPSQHKNVSLFFFGLALCFLIGLPRLEAQNENPLFADNGPIEIDLTFDQKKVFNDLEERKERPAQLRFNNQGTEEVHELKINVRGKTRAMKSTCKFPPLMLNFQKGKTKGTFFDGQNKLKLVTHCKNSKSYKDYVKKEYMAYRLYNVISPVSFRVRLCKINYRDSENPDNLDVHYGFLIEHIKDVGNRNGMKVFKDSIRNQESTDKQSMDRLAMFEFMIGNLDWSVPKRHNIKMVIGGKGSLPIAVPYDFDYSGLVNIPYAVPPEGFDIPDVRTRVFRGLCREQGYDETVSYYKNKQSEIMGLFDQASFLDEEDAEDMKGFLLDFFKLLQNQSLVNEKINQACWANHKHRFEY